jgi:hypothetical protein
VTSASNQEGYTPSGHPEARRPKVLGLGLLSAASAIAGGLAVAWWYRKTLTKLQNPIVSEDLQDMEYGEIDEESGSTQPANLNS